MTRTPRRHADGTLDLGHYRSRARRLRAIARRRMARALVVRLHRGLVAIGALFSGKPAQPLTA